MNILCNLCYKVYIALRCIIEAAPNMCGLRLTSGVIWRTKIFR